MRQSGRKQKITGDLDCDDSLGITHFFNQPLIPAELHVNYLHFEQCSDFVADTYVAFPNASYWIYPLLMKEKLKIWVYSGDIDADVPITGTKYWLERLREQ